METFFTGLLSVSYFSGYPVEMGANGMTGVQEALTRPDQTKIKAIGKKFTDSKRT